MAGAIDTQIDGYLLLCIFGVVCMADTVDLFQNQKKRQRFTMGLNLLLNPGLQDLHTGGRADKRITEIKQYLLEITVNISQKIREKVSKIQQNVIFYIRNFPVVVYL